MNAPVTLSPADQLRAVLAAVLAGHPSPLRTVTLTAPATAALWRASAHPSVDPATTRGGIPDLASGRADVPAYLAIAIACAEEPAAEQSAAIEPENDDDFHAAIQAEDMAEYADDSYRGPR